MDEKPPDRPDPPRLRFEIAQAAMLLLAVLVIAGALISLVFVVRCAISFVAPFCERTYGIKDWLSEVIVVLVALISRPREKD